MPRPRPKPRPIRVVDEDEGLDGVDGLEEDDVADKGEEEADGRGEGLDIAPGEEEIDGRGEGLNSAPGEGEELKINVATVDEGEIAVEVKDVEAERVRVTKGTDSEKIFGGVGK
ncbi:MAG: hypothetical protein Q9225_004602 [Loekoesia sp. 1 TL-2023]